MKHEKYNDPTADRAVIKASRDEEPKRYLPQDLYDTVKVVKDTFRLLGYEVTSMRITDRETCQRYIWGEETE